MNYDEYMKDLTEQIGNKRAKQLVSRELQNHIDEQAEHFEKEGMEHEEAFMQAVKEMGDPVAVGIEMNKIHRAKFPTAMFTIAVLLTMFGILLQSKIFLTIDNSGLRWSGLYRTIIFNLIGLGLALGIVFMDYTLIAKHIGKIFIAYFAFLMIMPVTVNLIPYYQGMLLLNLIIAVFPILFAAFLYKQRSKEWKGVLKCIGLLFGTMIFSICYVRFYLTGFWAETVLICTCLLIIAILKGIMGQQKVKMCLMVILPPIGLVSAFILPIVPLAPYQQARIDALLHPKKYMNSEYNYVGAQLHRLTKEFSVSGSHNFDNYIDHLSTTQMHTDFAVNSMFSWFGIVVGCIIIAALILVCMYSFYISWKQSNRMGFLFGTVCSLTLIIRITLYVLNNFGQFVNYATYFPFLKYGLGNALVNGILIGIIMCVYRNSDILGEHSSVERKGKYRVRLLVEKNE